MLAPSLFASWEWSTYDLRLRLRGPAPVSPHLLIIGRDADSDARFGVGVWDRARFARVISALGQGGAAVVAPDFHFAGVSPPERGGTASDEALIEATKVAGNVVYPMSSAPLLPGLVERARGVGHMAAIPDEDGVYRPMPVSLNVNGRAVPAFGVAIAAAFLRVSPDTITVPTDGRGRMLVDYAGRWEEGRIPYLPFVDVWDAIEEGRMEELRGVVSGKIVLLLQASLESDKRRTPLELKAPGGFIHANVINTILTGSALRELHPIGRAFLTFTMALISAWLLLSVTGWKGLSLVGVIGAMYAGLAQAFLAVEGLVLPVLPPLFGLAFAVGGTMAWTSLKAAGCIRTLEGEVAATQGELARTRETLAGQELTVERLEEDLEAARDEITVSGKAKEEVTQHAAELKTLLDGAQQKVEATRREMQRLEARLADLSVATVAGAQLSDAGLEALRQESEQLGIVTQDAKVLATFRDVKKAAQSTATILFLGETGTGKELFARAVHALSPRVGGPFVLVNMAAMPSGLVESALFGHVRGAFTGAIRDHKGFFEQAHRGTIFLDEIGDLPPEAQAKMLRVLQDGMFDPVGATSPTKVDVRIVAASNKDLRQEIIQRRFREDLYFRLKGIDFKLPPLRERMDDVPLLAKRFLREAAAKAGRNGLALSQKALDVLRRWTWQGNIRDLKNCIERACVMADGSLITEQDLRLETGSPVPASRQGGDESAMAEDVSGDQAVLVCLRRHGFDMQATAQALGWDRSTVTQRLKGLCFRSLAEHDGDPHTAASELAGDTSLVRIVELKLSNYYENLMETTEKCGSAEEALATCRRRLKNLPDRHMPSVKILIRLHFERHAALRASRP